MDWSITGWLAIFTLMTSPIVIWLSLKNEVTTMILWIVCLIGAVILGGTMVVDAVKWITRYKAEPNLAMTGRMSGTDPHHEQAKKNAWVNGLDDPGEDQSKLDREAMIEAKTAPIPPPNIGSGA